MIEETRSSGRGRSFVCAETCIVDGKNVYMWFGYLNQDHAHYYYTEYLDDNDGRLELTGNTQSREHYSVVTTIIGIMQRAVKPSLRYPVGKLYRGKPIWKKRQ